MAKVSSRQLVGHEEELYLISQIPQYPYEAEQGFRELGRRI